MILCILGISLSAAASEKKVYVHTDANGVLVFSDKPQPGAKEVNLNRHQKLIMPAQDTSILQRLQQAEQKAPASQYQVFIDQPSQEQTIRNNYGEIYVTGHVKPAFRSGFKVRLLLDGKQQQKPHANAIFKLKDIDRGEHTLVLELLDSEGQLLAVSEPRTIYLFRASAIRPN